jgi:hypothetical protein
MRGPIGHVSALLAAGCLLLGTLPGCYSFHSGRLPFKTLAVPAAINSTTDYRLTDVVTKSVIAAVSRDGSVSLGESGKTDGQLLIEIKGYAREPYRYSSQEEVTEYKITITVAAAVKDSKGEEIWKNETLSAWGSYQPATQDENEGIQQASDKLAEELLRQAFETW